MGVDRVSLDDRADLGRCNDSKDFIPWSSGGRLKMSP